MNPGATAAPLDRALAVALLRDMVRIRRFEEKCAELYSAGKIRGFLHLYIGEEAVAAGAMRALTPEDAVVATYREHGHALARGIDAGRLMAEMYGKQEGCSRGRGGSMHVFDAATRFYGGNAIVGGGLPIEIGGEVVGGIGVGGAPGAHLDDACSQAGLDAIGAAAKIPAVK